MFTWLGYRTARHRWWVLTLAGLFTVAAALWGTSVVQRLQGGGYADPDSESERARVHAERVIGAIGPDVLAIYSHPHPHRGRPGLPGRGAASPRHPAAR